MMDTQDKLPEIQEDLERVGVTGLRTLVKTSWKGHDYRFVPRIELTIDLKKDKKGAHMSRLVESITEAIEEESQDAHVSLEELGKSILARLRARHPYSRGEILLETELVIRDRTPVTGRNTMEAHDIKVRVVNEDGRLEKILLVEVLGNTVCPHSMEYAGKPHIQRAVGTLEIKSPFSNHVELEDMIDCVEKSFPAKVNTLLKTEDEGHVVEEMYANPMFVEDVTRKMLDNARRRFPDTRIRAKVVSQESIHRHDVVAEGFLTSKKQKP